MSESLIKRIALITLIKGDESVNRNQRNPKISVICDSDYVMREAYKYSDIMRYRAEPCNEIEKNV
jgi:hypothetical protein